MGKINHSKEWFGFEHFSAKDGQAWMKIHWQDAFLYSGIYVGVIFGLRYFMKSRTKWGLEQILFIWNLLLAGFSILGSARILPETMSTVSTNGFYHSVCYPLKEHSNVWNFWFFAFVLSKIPELGDTVFIVLRKNPLIFLHWYHHITVLMFCWYSYSQYVSTSRWFLCMNYSVHAVMYTYYALRAKGVKIAKPISVTITSLQILQMAVGIVVTIYALRMKLSGTECDVPVENLLWSLAMYSSYFALFVHFFQNNYFRTKEQKVSKLK